MAITFRITPAIENALTSLVVSGVGDLVRFCHGTSIEGATSITQGGLDAAKAFACGGEGYFWCSQDFERAKYFAHATMSNKPAIVNFSLPAVTIHELLASDEGWLKAFLIDEKPTHYFRFHWQSFGILNEVMTDVTVTTTATTVMSNETMTFTEE
jgi:hypothetical protein